MQDEPTNHEAFGARTGVRNLATTSRQIPSLEGFNPPCAPITISVRLVLPDVVPNVAIA